MRPTWWVVMLIAIAIALAVAGCARDEGDPAAERRAAYARVAELLQAPPLRPVPAQFDGVPVRAGTVDVRFADAAGVALLQLAGGRYEVIDLGSDAVLGSGKSSDGIRGDVAISPNGRVLATRAGPGVELRASETGEVLAALPTVHADELFFVGETALLHVVPAPPGSDKQQVVLLDFATGRVSMIAQDRNAHVLGVVPVPGRPGHLFVATGLAVYEVELSHAAEGWGATREHTLAVHLGHRPSADLVFAGDRLVPEGVNNIGHYVLPSLLFEGVSGSLAIVKQVLPTGDPDRALLRIVIEENSPNELRRDFTYSVSRGTLSPLPDDALPDNLAWSRPLQRLVTWDGDGLRAFVPPAAAGVEGSIDDMIANWRQPPPRVDVPTVALAAVDPSDPVQAVLAQLLQALRSDDFAAYLALVVDDPAKVDTRPGDFRRLQGTLSRLTDHEMVVSDVTDELDGFLPDGEGARPTGLRHLQVVACWTPANQATAVRDSMIVAFQAVDGEWRVVTGWPAPPRAYRGGGCVAP